MSNQLAHIEEYKTPKGVVDLNEVSQLLLAQMKEVKQNPAAIPQAECMSSIASRMVEIAVAQVKQGNMVLDMIRAKNDQGA
jgi:hypothetical protein